MQLEVSQEVKMVGHHGHGSGHGSGEDQRGIRPGLRAAIGCRIDINQFLALY